MKKIGIVGIGVISGIYLENITKLFKEIEIVAVCDLIKEKAEKAKKEYNIPKIYNTMEEMFNDKEIDIILNLTRPYEHFEVTKGALLAGKHVYTEKPLGATLEEGDKLVDIAKEKNLLICGAPDTFLGAGIQTCRKIIESGLIGEVVGASAFMVCRGHETWHADPEFYYKFGGGPMMDMGPYYLSALVNLVGNIKSVSGMSKITFPKRTITSQPLSGTVINVDVPTTVNGLMRFENGAIGTIFTTFDVHSAEVPRIEIYGSHGTLSVPDPNTFEGPIKLYRPEKGEFLEIPLMFSYDGNSRGLGLADMAKALECGRNPRANMSLIHHVLEAMTSFQYSSEQRKEIDLKTKYEKEVIMSIPEIKGVL
ncbi:MAG: Gfo/Idh/MocA family protein [Lachnospirales bacterium]